jgi:hypothetical protein
MVIMATNFALKNLGPDDFRAPLLFACVGSGTPLTPGANCTINATLERPGFHIPAGCYTEIQLGSPGWGGTYFELLLDDCTYTIMCSINAGGVDPNPDNNWYLASFP